MNRAVPVISHILNISWYDICHFPGGFDLVIRLTQYFFRCADIRSTITYPLQ